MTARLSLFALALAFLLSGCRCGEEVQSVRPVLAVSPSELDFGKVKVGSTAELTVLLAAQSQADVALSSIRLLDGAAPGGASALELVGVPQRVGRLSTVELTVRFRPTALQAYEARLSVASNDPERPTVDIPIFGEGAHPLLEVTAECLSSSGCRGTVVADPPSIDFGAEPLERAVPIPIHELPRLTILNAGEVPLAITQIAVVGAQGAAFVPEAGSELPGAGGAPLLLDGGNGVNLPIRFRPFGSATAFAAELVIQSDDPTNAEVRVPLAGTVRPNLPPIICANIVSVRNPNLAVRDYNTSDDWTPLLTVPAGGYDFSETRDIEPAAEVKLSALSNASDDRTCTTDPEDERESLSYLWSVTSSPEGRGGWTLQGETTPAPTLRLTRITGAYELSLRVSDRWGNASVTSLRFTAVFKRDLVVELSWTTSDVDLDLHLVRPSAVSDDTQAFSGVFSEFDVVSRTSGDINGFAAGRRSTDPALNFDWGVGGIRDDPALNFDDLGSGALIETISLNEPENDPLCVAASCQYKILVHYFEDRRGDALAAPACSVLESCDEGDVCTCTGAGERCVATEAPRDMPTSGAGKCRVAPTPEVRIFLRGNPAPAAVIPLSGAELVIGAPCQMLYAADVMWPAAGAPPDDVPEVVVRSPGNSAGLRSRFGVRAAGNLTACTPDVDVTSWFSEQPL